MEICIYALKFLELEKNTPKLFFVMRDCADANKNEEQKALEDMIMRLK